MDGGKEQQGPPERQPGKKLIKIPSYQEVFGTGGSSSSSTPPSYNPPLASAAAPAASSSGSFSQAFSFLKSSEFYSPPPPPPPQPTSTPRPQASSSAPATQSKNAILVSHRQRGNPLLKHIRNARWTFADVVPDYVLGQSSCALYLSIRYHLLHSDYLYYRIRELQKNFRLRVILCHVDVEDVVKPLHEITRTALLHDCTLLCGWRRGTAPFPFHNGNIEVWLQKQIQRTDNARPPGNSNLFQARTTGTLRQSGLPTA